VPGAPDPIYVCARRALLDALEALRPHRRGVILVGAQAIYLHTGEGDLAVAPYTTDGDLALDPSALADHPKIDDAMRGIGFERSPDRNLIGSWISPDGVPIDLLVPAADRRSRPTRGAAWSARRSRGAQGARTRSRPGRQPDDGDRSSRWGRWSSPRSTGGRTGRMLWMCSSFASSIAVVATIPGGGEMRWRPGRDASPRAS
jgi:hypothetical protein